MRINAIEIDTKPSFSLKSHSGIAESALKFLATYAVTPHIIIIGRSKEAADRITKELENLGPVGHTGGAKVTFICADVSLIKNADELGRNLAGKLTHVNLLYMSTSTGLTDTTGLYI